MCQSLSLLSLSMLNMRVEDYVSLFYFNWCWKCSFTYFALSKIWFWFKVLCEESKLCMFDNLFRLSSVVLDSLVGMIE